MSGPDLLTRGVALLEGGDARAALQPLARAAALLPMEAEPAVRLGAAFLRLGLHDQALLALDKARTLDESRADLFHYRGAVLAGLGRWDAAAASFRCALERDATLWQSWLNLSAVHLQVDRPSAAADAASRALALAPRADCAYALGNALRTAGAVAESLTYLEQAARHATGLEGRRAASTLLHALNCVEGSDADGLIARRQEIASIYRPDPPRPRPPARPQSGPLRIGYVSADFRAHSVAFFLEPVLRHHDAAKIQVTCYAAVAAPDQTTARLRALVTERWPSGWRDIGALEDEDAAALIRADGVDLLVDLNGHTDGARLGLFGLRPAPAQATWLGYPNSTGLPEIDARLSDATADPIDRPGERIWRIPRGFHCYQPPLDAPEPTPLPALSNGVVTFASFNGLAKLSDRTVGLWAAVLRALPQSRLLLKAGPLAEAQTADRHRRRFAACGVAPERLVLIGPDRKQADHLARYRCVDIGLDSFPYNGATTTCEALWMGVPVVTLRGESHAARVGASLLGQVGMNGLIARDEDEFIAAAAALAAEPRRLGWLRDSLRARMRSAPLMDGPSFARRIEAVFERIAVARPR